MGFDYKFKPVASLQGRAGKTAACPLPPEATARIVPTAPLGSSTVALPHRSKCLLEVVGPWRLGSLVRGPPISSSKLGFLAAPPSTLGEAILEPSASSKGNLDAAILAAQPSFNLRNYPRFR